MSLNDAACAAIYEMRDSLIARINQLEERITLGSEAMHFFALALKTYREENRNSLDMPMRVMRSILTVGDLTFPQKKMLQVLAEAYSYDKAQFEEQTYSAIVRSAKVSKHGAKAHLEKLRSRNLIRNRTDGYRSFYSINQAAFQNL